MLTAFSHYNLNGLPDTENEAPSPEAPGFALSLSLLRRSMSDLACGARLDLPEGTAFRDLLSSGAGFLSLGHTFTLGNPDRAGTRRQGPGQAGKPSGALSDSEKADLRIPLVGRGELPPDALIAASASGKPARAEADDFKYLCRLFGERFSAVEAFRVRSAMTFIPADGPGENVMSYQLAEIVMMRRYEADVVSFFELVRNKGGNNFILYWEALPDIFGELRTGEARGCTVRCEALAVRSLVSDDSRAEAELPLVLPTVERLAALIGRLYRKK